jgi:hypothetical protein
MFRTKFIHPETSGLRLVGSLANIERCWRHVSALFSQVSRTSFVIAACSHYLTRLRNQAEVGIPSSELLETCSSSQLGMISPISVMPCVPVKLDCQLSHVIRFCPRAGSTWNLGWVHLGPTQLNHCLRNGRLDQPWISSRCYFHFAVLQTAI